YLKFLKELILLTKPFQLNVFLILLVSFTSCMHQPVRRNPIYNRPTNYSSNQPQFSPIKKKVALLKFYNESPFGKEDLAITATEEMRREVARMRDFVIDMEGASLFGDSKEIYAGGGIKLAQMTRKAKLSGINLV